MNRLFEISSVLIFSFFLLFFLASYSFVPSLIPFSLQDVVWNHRVIESLAQGILIFAVVIGILSLERE